MHRRDPQIGDVVEYPLRAIETEDFNDGRSHGVGLLVGRNMDRGKLQANSSRSSRSSCTLLGRNRIASGISTVIVIAIPLCCVDHCIHNASLSSTSSSRSRA